MKKIAKQQNHAFGKDIYLLGVDSDNQNVWLEAPSWDCNWYWGFGYVERYTNNNKPHLSKDIISHTHIDSEFKKTGKIDLNNYLVKQTFTIEDGEHLNSLFNQFYKLRQEADKKEKLSKDINENQIPLITNKIIELLKP